MNVKFLFFPLVITVVLFLSIFYIKPEITSAMDNRALVATKQKTSDTIKMKAQNVQTLESSINGNKQAEALVMKYLPSSRDDDRIVDAINFLASQSGLTLSSVKLEKVALDIAETPEDATKASSETLLNADPTLAGDVPEVKEAAAKTRDISVVMVAQGSYEGIKDTINKISKMDRFQNFANVDIKHIQETEGNSGNLEATIVMRAAYLSPVKSQGKFNREILEKSAFSFDTVKALQTQISSPVPAIEVGAVGASNPFVR